MDIGNGKPLHEIMASILGGNKEDNIIGKQNTTMKVDKEVKKPEEEKVDTADIIKSAPTRPDPNKADEQDVDGVADGILVVTDPEITSEEFEEVADELQGIVDNSEAGELPYTDKYKGDYILSCPICGGTFVSDTLLESGEDTCPICCKIPDAFVVSGRIEGEESADSHEDIQDNIDHEENLEEPEEQDISKEQDVDNQEEDETKKESIDMKGNKLQEGYVEDEQALAKDYEERVINNITDNARESFKELKEILDEETSDTSVDGYYFPAKAVAVLENTKQYHLNGYMDLTVSDVLNMVDDCETIEEAIHELFEDYKPDSAFSWADNFITVLDKLDFDMSEEDLEELDDLEESKKLNESSIWQDNSNTLNDLLEKAVEELEGDELFELLQGMIDRIKSVGDECGLLLEGKKEEARVHRVLNKGDRFQNKNGVIATIIDVDNEHLLDGQPQVTYRFNDGAPKCYPMNSVNDMLNDCGYTKMEESEKRTVKTESRDRVAENLPKFIYDLTSDADVKAFGESAWSANEPTSNGLGITVYEVYRNGKSTFTSKNIADAVTKEFPELRVYGWMLNDKGVVFTKKDTKKEESEKVEEKKPSTKGPSGVFEDEDAKSFIRDIANAVGKAKEEAKGASIEMPTTWELMNNTVL